MVLRGLIQELWTAVSEILLNSRCGFGPCRSGETRVRSYLSTDCPTLRNRAEATNERGGKHIVGSRVLRGHDSCT